MGHQLQLVEARDAKMVLFPEDGGPNGRRTGHFLKPVGSFAHQTTGVSPSPPLPGYDDVRPSSLYFNGWCHPLTKWARWVAKMERLHGEEWDAVGIRGAIRASTCKIKRQPELIWEMIRQYWCVETNTFIFTWAEATPTLEDISILGGLPLFGEPAVALEPLSGDFAEMHQRLVRERRAFYAMAAAKPAHSSWLKYYMDENGAGEDDELEHVAFLSLWLSRCVFPGPVKETIGNHVFPVAVHLAAGSRLALAPAVLASLYRDLRVLRTYASTIAEVHSTGSSVVVWAPFQLLQMWVWERFSSLQPTAGPHSLRQHEPRAARWHNLEASPVTSAPVFRRREFQWRPYAANAEGDWLAPPFYPDVGRWVDGRSERDEGLLSFSRCLAPSELAGLESIEQYLPHRVSMQLGFDQDIPAVVRRENSYSWELAWSTYNKPINKICFYVPCRFSTPQVTLQFRRWWKLTMWGGKSFSGEGQEDDGVHDSVQDAQNVTTRMELQQAQSASEMEQDSEANCTSIEDGREQAPVEVPTAGLEVEDIDSMPLSSWLGCCRAKRQRTALAELQPAVSTSPLQHKLSETCESPSLPKSLSSAAKQPESGVDEGRCSSLAAGTGEVSGTLGSLQHAEGAGEVEENARASIVKPGESICNPITIDDPEEVYQVKLEQGEVSAPIALDKREIASQIDRVDGELARLRAMMGLASKHR